MIKRRKKAYVVQPDGSKIDMNDNPLIAVKDCKAGNMLYKGYEIPQQAKLFTDKFGEECYLAGVQIKDGVWLATVCYFTRDKDRYYTNLYDKIAPYFE
jgi:hypothetical protein